MAKLTSRKLEAKRGGSRVDFQTPESALGFSASMDVTKPPLPKEHRFDMERRPISSVTVSFMAENGRIYYLNLSSVEAKRVLNVLKRDEERYGWTHNS